MDLPRSPGLYFVRLRGLDLVSVNADRKSISERCIKVNCQNSKYGKAKDLRRRYREYCKVFGSERVIFSILFETENFTQAEKFLHKRFQDFRMRGLTGRLNEWLEGIEPDAALAIAQKICATEKIHSVSSNEKISERPNKTENEAMLFRPSNNCKFFADDVATMSNSLERLGLTVELLRDLHHFDSRSETFRSVERYFSGRQGDLRGRNITFSQRLAYVLKNYEPRKNSLTQLTKDACQIYPL